MIKKLILRVSEKNDLFKNIESNLNNKKFTNIVSLNPENVTIASENEIFQKIYLDEKSLVVADGVGITWAAKMLGIKSISRMPGVDLMDELVRKYKNKKILFLGGKNGVATKVAKHYKDNVNTSGEYIAIPDVDKNDPNIINEVKKIRPDMLFVAFGSPAQEIWIDENKINLEGILCMGVGGGFDFLAGLVARAPKIVRNIGLEWIFRLIIEPWRAKRQVRLFKFVLTVLLEILGY